MQAKIDQNRSIFPMRHKWRESIESSGITGPRPPELRDERKTGRHGDGPWHGEDVQEDAYLFGSS
jgi:hypothetical protein